MNLVPALGGCALLATALLSSCAPYDPYVYGAPPPRSYPGYGYSPHSYGAYGCTPYGYGPAYPSLSSGWFGGGGWGGRSSWWGRYRYDHHDSHHHHQSASMTRSVTGFRMVHAGGYQRDPRPLEPFASGSRHSAITPRSSSLPSPGTFDRGSLGSLRADASLRAVQSAPAAALRLRELRPLPQPHSLPGPSHDRGGSRSFSPVGMRSGEMPAAIRSRSPVLTSSRGSSEARFGHERR